MKITVRYSAIDGFRRTRTFRTLQGAEAWATHYVGKDADFGQSYAVSSDGVGKVTVTGCTIGELFSGVADRQKGAYEVYVGCVDEDCGRVKFYLDSDFDTLTAANARAQKLDEEGCDGVELFGRTDEAKAAIEAQRQRYTAQSFMGSPF